MPVINPYLNFNGSTEEAFNFYKSVLGGEFLAVHRFKDTPDGAKFSETDQEKIMHISLPVGNGNVLMATDTLDSALHHANKENNFSLSLETESKEEADKIFNGLSMGGKIEMPMQDVYWGSYFGMFTDKFGIRWMVSHSYEQQK